MSSKDRKISVFEFLSEIRTEEEAVEFLEYQRWGDTPRCPRCGSENVVRTPVTAPQPWRCRPCRKYHSVRTNTVMAQTQLPLRKWLYAIFMMHIVRKGISALQLAKELGITHKSAWFLEHRIRKAMDRIFRCKGYLDSGLVSSTE